MRSCFQPLLSNSICAATLRRRAAAAVAVRCLPVTLRAEGTSGIGVAGTTEITGIGIGPPIAGEIGGGTGAEAGGARRVTGEGAGEGAGTEVGTTDVEAAAAVNQAAAAAEEATEGGTIDVAAEEAAAAGAETAAAAAIVTTDDKPFATLNSLFIN